MEQGLEENQLSEDSQPLDKTDEDLKGLKLSICYVLTVDPL